LTEDWICLLKNKSYSGLVMAAEEKMLELVQPYRKSMDALRCTRSPRRQPGTRFLNWLISLAIPPRQGQLSLSVFVSSGNNRKLK
jgi:hypothetical protein